MKVHSFGVETVPVAMAKDLVVGSVHDGRNYRIMLARVVGEEIIETRFLAGEHDWESHSGAELDSGYIIGGAVEGVATPDGGEGWKAYVARLDESLNVLWERKIDMGKNGAVYSVLPTEEGLFIAGETGRPGDKGFFLGKLSLEGELLWLRDFGRWNDAVFTALLPFENGFKLIGSVKTGRWEVKGFDFGSSGNLLGEEALAEGIALTAGLWCEKLVLAGYQGENLWVRVGKRDITLGEGTATSMFATKDCLLVGGELEGNGAVLKIGRDGKILWKKELWKNGAVEVLTETSRSGRWRRKIKSSWLGGDL